MTREEGLLAAPYRSVRAIRAPHDGPWPGTLVSTPDGSTLVRVDVAVLGDDWWGWRVSPGGHVLAPRDVIRRADGHDAALPVCAERLDDFLRRRAARMPLSTGEAVTIGVSLLRGCGQLADAPEVTGEWWLDASGMPVLATDTADGRALDAAAHALASVEVEPRLRSPWHTAIEAITADRIAGRDLLDAEDALFAAAPAEPLVTVTLSPRSAVDAGIREPYAPAVAGDDARRSVWQSLIGHVDADLADTVSHVTTAAWRRMRAPIGSRRAPWVVGGAAAVAVLIGGALWPSAGGVATVAETSSESPAGADLVPGPDGQAVVPSPSATTAAPPESGSSSAALDQIATALLDRRLGCGTDAECLASVVDDPAVVLTQGTIDLPAAARTVTLLDDFGGVAVVRVDAVDAELPAQLVVIARRDDEWLLRDVHDVAQQP